MALQHPLVVYNAADHVEAHLLCNALVDAGIDAYVIDDVSQVGTSAFGLLPEIHKPQIWVERGDVERAKAFYREAFGFKPGDFPVAESVSQRTIALPFFTRLTEREIDLICQTLELMMTRASFSRS